MTLSCHLIASSTLPTPCERYESGEEYAGRMAIFASSCPIETAPLTESGR